jgi:ABC-2 type transport system permease protein
VQRVQTFEAERAAASAADRSIWVGQGADNPHAAAHFSRYAFKPIPTLGLFDPGALDTAGVAVWMEGHYQNPAQFRRIEDAPLGLRVAQFSPAWVLVLLGSLAIIVALHGIIAGEREDGTLRQVLATGLDPRHFAAGKIVAALVYAGALLAVGLVVTLGVASAARITAEPDLFPRAALLVLAYALFFITVAAVSIGVSALSSARRVALGALVGLWASTIVVGPYVAAQIALKLYPDVDGPAAYERIVEASNGFFRDKAARDEALKQALVRYGVQRKADLPLRYDGYELQYSEEIAHPKFEKLYGEVHAVHDAQERVLITASAVLPGLSIGSLSSTLAGTDRQHHLQFTAAAEAHRRKIVKMLNDDLTFNDLGRKGAYTADQTLWEQIPDFAMAPPRLDWSASRSGLSFAILAGQAVLGLLFAVWAIQRAARKVSQ